MPIDLWWTAWIVRAEQFAYGSLELKPWEFWELTLAEFDELRYGYYRRRRQDLEQQATWVTVLVNSYPMRGKNAKSLRVEQLIGQSPEQVAAMVRERERKRRKAAEAAEQQEPRIWLPS